MTDGLALFLASCDPVKVAREWTSASLDDALLEVPRHGAKGTEQNRQSRAARLLAEVERHQEETP